MKKKRPADHFNCRCGSLKPPIGIIPEHIWKEQIQGWVDANGGITMSDFMNFRIARMYEINKAVIRYDKANKVVPWILAEEAGWLLSLGGKF